VRQVTLVHHDDMSLAKRNLVTVGNFVFFTVRHFDEEGDSFLNGGFYMVASHNRMNLPIMSN
jgi:hypothetical protein